MRWRKSGIFRSASIRDCASAVSSEIAAPSPATFSTTAVMLSFPPRSFAPYLARATYWLRTGLVWRGGRVGIATPE